MSKLLASMMSGKKQSLNATIVGNPTISSDFIVSGFKITSTSNLSGNYLIIPTTQNYTSNWEFITKIKIPTKQSGTYVITNKKESGYFVLSSDNQKITSYYSDGFYYTENIWYWISCSQEKGFCVSTDGINYTQYAPIPNTVIFGIEQPLGRAIRTANYNQKAFNGEIDMKETLLKHNNEIVWQGVI